MPLDFSWRLRDPDLLNFVLDQKTRSICWAISIVRHLEAVYRLDGTLVRLSVQELVNIMPRNMLSRNGCLLDLDALASFVVSNGTVAQEECPFTCVVHQATRTQSRDLERYRPVQVKKVNYNGLTTEEFDEKLWTALQISPFAARVVSTMRFDTIIGDEIYKPEEGELIQGHGHMVLITGCGTDELGNPYWEAQDSYGERQGQSGIIRIARMDDLITDFFEIMIGVM